MQRKTTNLPRQEHGDKWVILSAKAVGRSAQVSENAVAQYEIINTEEENAID